MLNAVLWILALPVMAATALLAYVFGYRAGKTVGIEIARREGEAWRDRTYCGTAQAAIERLSGDSYK
jgi:hypothetical protein